MYTHPRVQGLIWKPRHQEKLEKGESRGFPISSQSHLPKAEQQQQLINTFSQPFFNMAIIWPHSHSPREIYTGKI